MKSIALPENNAVQENSAPPALDRLPLAGLLALAAAGFITILTEALPAGLLRQMGADLAVSEALIGQLVTAYAIGSLLAAIPLTAATRGWRRRPLLLLAIAGFVAVNTVTAVSGNYLLTLAARFFAGVFAGLVWGLLAGYASRMVPAHLRGRAIAVAMLGTPLALSLGIPLGTLLGTRLGWQAVFGIVSALTVLLLGWVRWQVPDFPGQAAGQRIAVFKVLGIPGIKPVLAVIFLYVLAHNVLYTYIAPFLALAGMPERVDLLLFVFGLTALLSIWITGAWIDRRLRSLVLASIILFALAAAALGVWARVPAVMYAGIGAWGLAFGGAATLFQTASANAAVKVASEAADLGQSMIVTVWNLAIAGGGVVGGVLLDSYGAASLPWALLTLLLPALCIAWRASAHGFPPARSP